MFGIPDPAALLQPWKSLKEMSEGLYAMFTKQPSGGAPVATQESFKNPKPSQSEPIRPDEPPSAVTTDRHYGGVAPPVSTTSTVRETRVEQVRQRTQPDLHGDSPARVAPSTEELIRHESMPNDIPEPTKRVDNPFPKHKERKEEPAKKRTPDDIPKRRPPKPYSVPFGPTMDVPSPGGTTVFIGKVVSGSGNIYQVALYANGLTQSPDDGTGNSAPVTVTIPFIDPADEIPVGTVLSAIFQFTDPTSNNITYSCQPAVWLP